MRKLSTRWFVCIALELALASSTWAFDLRGLMAESATLGLSGASAQVGSNNDAQVDVTYGVDGLSDRLSSTQAPCAQDRQLFSVTIAPEGERYSTTITVNNTSYARTTSAVCEKGVLKCDGNTTQGCTYYEFALSGFDEKPRIQASTCLCLVSSCGNMRPTALDTARNRLADHTLRLLQEQTAGIMESGRTTQGDTLLVNGRDMSQPCPDQPGVQMPDGRTQPPINDTVAGIARGELRSKSSGSYRCIWTKEPFLSRTSRADERRGVTGVSKPIAFVSKTGSTYTFGLKNASNVTEDLAQFTAPTDETGRPAVPTRILFELTPQVAGCRSYTINSVRTVTMDLSCNPTALSWTADIEFSWETLANEAATLRPESCRERLQNCTVYSEKQCSYERTEVSRSGSRGCPEQYEMSPDDSTPTTIVCFRRICKDTVVNGRSTGETVPPACRSFMGQTRIFQACTTAAEPWWTKTVELACNGVTPCGTNQIRDETTGECRDLEVSMLQQMSSHYVSNNPPPGDTMPEQVIGVPSQDGSIQTLEPAARFNNAYVPPPCTQKTCIVGMPVEAGTVSLPQGASTGTPASVRPSPAQQEVVVRKCTKSGTEDVCPLAAGEVKRRGCLCPESDTWSQQQVYGTMSSIFAAGKDITCSRR